jgi:hypothetical protein
MEKFSVDSLFNGILLEGCSSKSSVAFLLVWRAESTFSNLMLATMSSKKKTQFFEEWASQHCLVGD